MNQFLYGGVAFEVAFNSFYMDLFSPFSYYDDILTINCRALDHAYIYNNIFAGKNPRVIFDFNIPDSSDIRITYNCFYSNRPMTRPHIGHSNGTGTIDSVYGNVYADPMFVDYDNGDLRLQKGSPCIDAGAPWILDPDGTRSDIGAFGGPGGSVYTYQDLPPKAPANFQAWWNKNRVILGWVRTAESDFRHYILFRATEPNAPLDSQHVLAYLNRLGKPIDNGRRRPPGFGDGSKPFDPEEYIPRFLPDYLTGTKPCNAYYVDWHPIDTLASYYTLITVDSSGLVSSASQVELTAPQAVGPPQGDIVGRVPDTTGASPSEEKPDISSYPNPFNATTALVYNLPNIGAQPAPVRLSIYNILGQEIKSLANERQQPGRHVVYWDGTDQYGQPVASGVYLYRLEVSGIEFVKSGKMILMK